MNFIADGKAFEVTEAPIFEVSDFKDFKTGYPTIISFLNEVNYALLKTTNGTHLFVTTEDDETHIDIVEDLSQFKFPIQIYDEPEFLHFLNKNNLNVTNLSYMVMDQDNNNNISCTVINDKYRVFSNIPSYGFGSFEDGENIVYAGLFNQGANVSVVTNGLSKDGNLDTFSIEKKLVKKLISTLPCGHLQPDNLKEILKRIGMVTFDQRHSDEEDVVLGNIMKHPNNPLIIGNAKLYGPIILEKEITITQTHSTTYKCAYFEDKPNVMSVAIFELIDGEFKMIYTDELTDWTPKHLQHLPPVKHGLVLTQTLPDLFEKLNLPLVNEYFGYIPTFCLAEHTGTPLKVETLLGKFKTTSDILGVIEISKNKSLVVLDHPTHASGFKPIVFKINIKKGKLKPSSINEMIMAINHHSHREIKSHAVLFENLDKVGFFKPSR